MSSFLLFLFLCAWAQHEGGLLVVGCWWQGVWLEIIQVGRNFCYHFLDPQVAVVFVCSPQRPRDQWLCLCFNSNDNQAAGIDFPEFLPEFLFLFWNSWLENVFAAFG